MVRNMGRILKNAEDTGLSLFSLQPVNCDFKITASTTNDHCAKLHPDQICVVGTMLVRLPRFTRPLSISQQCSGISISIKSYF